MGPQRLGTNGCMDVLLCILVSSLLGLDICDINDIMHVMVPINAACV